MLTALALCLASAFPIGPHVPAQPIIGGSEVAACGWPSVVALDGTCSGTLVHPQVVLYAAHCGPNVHFVTPGEIEADGTPVDAECVVNPDWDHEAGGNLRRRSGRSPTAAHATRVAEAPGTRGCS